ncbi:TonB-dependent receptor-like protein [Novosphingobium kunmingense]|uniref:TonB-dependent receptor-like protein n=1 Tax=Novosphingobium kunmingense TaxID=1211806 RepID=A0A2N0H364_9SPHN|nr:TonB-dependent receptor [Novosphingobium kunmingense]PKB13368.1 TonB-dependent receptor-like protein [Novosphingobium kunmingense]
MIQTQPLRARYIGVSLISLALAAFASPALAAGQSSTPAQDDRTAAEAQPAAVEPGEATTNADGTDAGSGEIVVTGSRVPRAGFTAPTPITIVGTEQLAKAAPSTLAESLRQLPALTNTAGPQRNAGSQRVGQSFLDLRSLGPNRTLTLLDGRRVVSTSLTGSVDANILPSGVVQRVEVVTGGASAAYGSDAVAGVVNFILDSEFSGLKGEVSKGISQYGDNAETRATLSGGTGFAGGQGHVLVSAEYFKNDGVKPGARPWARTGVNFINNPGGTPALFLQSDIRAVGTLGGLIIGGNGGTAANNALFNGIQFLPGGVAAPYSYGTLTTATQQVGGDGVSTELIQELNRPLERGSLYAHVSFDVSDNFTLFADGMYGRSTSTVNNTYNRRQPSNPFTIQRDNAYLATFAPQIRDRMLATGVTSLTMLRFSSERGFIVTKGDSETLQGTLGAKGKIGDLKWNAYYTHGETKQSNDVLNNEITANFNRAIDAVFVTAANVGTSGLAVGSIACRVNVDTNPNNNDPSCAPFNVFGVGSPSDAALNYTRGTSASDALIKADLAAVSLAGPLFEGWAGPIDFAIGGEYRKESINFTTDALSPTGAYLLGNPTPWSGSYNVKEAFAELVVPLLKDVPFFRQLELNAAGRITDYSTSGKVETWKLGLSWKPVEDLRLRATRSRDIRAPNLSELFQAGRQSIAAVNDPFKNNVRVTGILQINSGNPNLTPEFADTFTAGAIYSPSWLPGLNLSVDYYDISIKNAISPIPAQTAVDQCFLNVQSACDLFTRDANGNITRFAALPINLASAKTRGVDFEAGYSIPRGFAGLDGQFSVRVLASYLAKQETTQPGGAPVDRAGEAGVNPFPRWRGLAQINYDGEHTGAFLQARFIGSGDYDKTRGPALIDLQHVPAAAYLDGQISKKIAAGSGEVELFLNVRNILNSAPPLAPENATLPVAYNALLHDVLGRVFRVGAKFKY